MSNKKLPVPYNKPRTEPAPVDRVHTPVHNQGVLGKVFSAFTARLNTRTFERNTEEVEAHTKYRRAETDLAEAWLKRDRTIEHYIKHRDDIIADDHDEHVDQMEANRTARAFAREEREHQMQLIREKRKEQLNEARFSAATTQWGLDAFTKSLSHREERVDEMYRTGALDAQIRTVLLNKKLDQVRAKEKPIEAAPKQQQSSTEQMLQFIDLQIENAAANHASQEVIDNLIEIRAGLSSQLDIERNRSE